MDVNSSVEWVNRVAAANSTEAAVLHHCLWTMECAYWEDVDFNAGRDAARFYSEDAVFDIGLGGARFEGRRAIADFYAGRHAQGPRTSLHRVHNFALLDWEAQSARTRAVVSLIAADGTAPQPSAVPLMITAAETRYTAINGGWKIAARLNAPCFIDRGYSLEERIAATKHVQQGGRTGLSASGAEDSNGG